jgi:hypothetical protein
MTIRRNIEVNDMNNENLLLGVYLMVSKAVPLHAMGALGG